MTLEVRISDYILNLRVLKDFGAQWLKNLMRNLALYISDLTIAKALLSVTDCAPVYYSPLNYVY